MKLTFVHSACFTLLAGMTVLPASLFGGEQDDLLRTVMDGYRANRDAFPYMVTRSTVTEGTADTLEKAFAGEILLEHSNVGQGYYAQQGDRYRVEILYPPGLREKYRTRVSDQEWTVAFDSEREAGNRNLRVLHSPYDKYASVQPVPRERWSIYQSPFNFGLLGGNRGLELDRVIEGGLQGSRTVCKYEGEEKIDGRTTWILNAGFVRFWVDPERGFLPIRMEFPGTAISRTVEIARCSGGRWLPTRVITAFLRSSGSGVPFRETHILQFEVDQEPRPEDLRLDLPEETSVYDAISEQSWYVGQSGKPSYLEPEDYVDELKARPEKSRGLDKRNQKDRQDFLMNPGSPLMRGFGEFPTTTVISESQTKLSSIVWMYLIVSTLALLLAGRLTWKPAREKLATFFEKRSVK